MGRLRTAVISGLALLLTAGSAMAGRPGAENMTKEEGEKLKSESEANASHNPKEGRKSGLDNPSPYKIVSNRTVANLTGDFIYDAAYAVEVQQDGERRYGIVIDEGRRGDNLISVKGSLRKDRIMSIAPLGLSGGKMGIIVILEDERGNKRKEYLYLSKDGKEGTYKISLREQ